MSKAKIAITLDQSLLTALDGLVKQNAFANRSQAIAEALKEKLTRLQKSRLETECRKLDSEEERNIAEMGIAGEKDEWPDY